MQKTIFLTSLMTSIVTFVLTMSAWFDGSTDFGLLHLLLLVVSVIGLTCSAFAVKDFVHVDDLFENSYGPDDYEWGTLDAMLNNYKRYYETELKNSPLYESGMRDITEWLTRVEEMRNKG